MENRHETKREPSTDSNQLMAGAAIPNSLVDENLAGDFSVLAVVSGLLQQAKQNDENRLQSAANSVADIRKASNQLESIRIQAESYRESVEFAAILEQRDLPLSLLQTIGECCQSLDGHLQLKSLKMTETSAGKSKRQPASVSSRPDNQPLQDSRQGHK